MLADAPRNSQWVLCDSTGALRPVGRLKATFIAGVKFAQVEKRAVAFRLGLSTWGWPTDRGKGLAVLVGDREGRRG